MKLDWLDAILFSVGFAGTVALATTLKMNGVAAPVVSFLSEGGTIALCVGLLVLRRVLFGAPQLPEPKTGFLWSLVSVLGLFLTLAGAGALFFSARFIADSFSKAPDFQKKALAFEKELKFTNSTLFNFQLPNETRKAFLLRMKNAPKKRQRERQQRIQKRAVEYKVSWLKQQQRARKKGFSFGGFALLFLGLGALCNFLRYPSSASEET